MTEWFGDFVQSGAIVLMACAVLIAEGLFYMLARRRVPRPASLLLTIASGFALLGALHAALSGAGTIAIALWLILALCAHMLDMITRLRGPG
ncbi:MAG: hypothetical protein JJ902_14490 [Roseibium sp.]|nr:hypothetical protein [Roseibium sp.]